MKCIAVFASGSGTNLQALIDDSQRRDCPFRIGLVVSNRKKAYALQRARDAGIPAEYIPYRKQDPLAYSRAVRGSLNAHAVAYIVLAGFLKFLPKPVLQQYDKRIINIHPALLPAFGGKGAYGLRVHQAAREYGVRISGVTVHFVNDQYDAGPVIAQVPVWVRQGDSAESLQQRVLEQEHYLLVKVVRYLCKGYIAVQGRQVTVSRVDDPADKSYFGLA